MYLPHNFENVHAEIQSGDSASLTVSEIEFGLRIISTGKKLGNRPRLWATDVQTEMNLNQNLSQRPLPFLIT